MLFNGCSGACNCASSLSATDLSIAFPLQALHESLVALDLIVARHLAFVLLDMGCCVFRLARLDQEPGLHPLRNVLGKLWANLSDQFAPGIDEHLVVACHL